MSEPTAEYALNANQQQTVEQVRVLWPHLRFDQRLEWAHRLAPWFRHNFAAAVKALQNDGSGAEGGEGT